MKLQVEMLAFMDKGVFREVDIPEGEDMSTQDRILELAFKYGQNDFQPQPDRASVSVGDVVYLNGKKFLIKGSGFTELNDEFYQGFCNLPQRERSFFAMVD